MRALLGIVGAIAGAALGIFYLGALAGDLFIGFSIFRSPDEAQTSHNAAYLVTTFVAMVIGYFVGSAIGGLLSKSSD